MTVQTNAFLTYDSVGNRENLAEVITSLSPEETPITNAIGSTDAKGILYEWQTDALAAADSDNAVLEGDIVDGTASTPTTREKNYCQISRRDVVVSSTQEKVKKAGRSSEMGYQVAKRLKELKRDIEAVIVGNQGYNAGASGTARRTRSFESFLATNVDREAGGANAAAATDAATDSITTRAFTETMLKTVIQSCYTEGAAPKTLSVGPFNKGVVSGFTGRSQARHAISEDRIQAAAHLYASDFGEIKVSPNRFQRERTALIIDPEYAELAFLRQPQVKDLARTGDSERKYVVAEYALCIKNEKAHGMMAAVKSWWDESLGGLSSFAADTGAANAYAIAPVPAITGYAAGQAFHFFAANANSGAAVLTVSGLGPQVIQLNGAALVSGDIGVGDLVSVVYDGTQFQLPGIPTSLSLTSLTVDTDTFHVDSANNRNGIGTTAPSTPLHIKSSAATAYSSSAIQIGDNTLLLENDDTTVADIFSQIVLRTKRNSANNEVRVVGVSDANNETSLKLVIENAGVPTEGLVIDNNANVDLPNGNLAIGGNTALPVDQLTEFATATNLNMTNDKLLVWDNSAALHKSIKLQDFGVKVVTEAAAQTFAFGDANTLQTSTSATGVSWTIPPNTSVAFAIGTIIQVFQSGAGQVTLVAGSGVTLRAPNGLKSSQQYAVAAITKVAADEWVVYGDLAI